MQRRAPGGRRLRRATGRKWPPTAVGAALIVGSAGLGTLAAATRPSAVLAPVTNFGLTGLLLLEGAVAGAAAPLLFLAGLRRIGATKTAVLSLCEPLTATLLAAVMFRQLPAPTQVLGAVLLVGAGVAVQIVPARRARPEARRVAAGAGSAVTDTMAPDRRTRSDFGHSGTARARSYGVDAAFMQLK